MKMSKCIPNWETYVKIIKHFIDDSCAFLDPAAETSDKESAIKFDEFKLVVNGNIGLTWGFTELSNSVNCLDLMLSSMPDEQIKNFLRSH